MLAIWLKKRWAATAGLEDFSRAAGDMGLETGLSSSSSPGGTWQVEASGDGVDNMVSY